MKHWLVSLLVAIAIVGVCYLNAVAATDNTDVNTASKWCYTLLKPDQFISPLVQCFTDSKQGIIPLVTLKLIGLGKTTYLPLVGVMFIIAIAYFGLKLMMGDVQRVKADTIILGLKIAGVLCFMNNASAIYIDMISILQSMSQFVSAAATTVNYKSPFCPLVVPAFAPGSSGSTSDWQFGSSGKSMWDTWDCIFSYLFGLGGTLAEDSIASFLLLMIFSMGAGILVFFFALYLIVTMLCAAFRFVHIYLMSMLALSFMFMLGYIFVPLLLFKNTFDYFKKWLMMVFGFILTPVIMFAFMGIMLVSMDIALFTGKYSIWCSIGGPDYCANGTKAGSNYKVVDVNNPLGGESSMFSDYTQHIDTKITDPLYSDKLQDQFKSLFSVALNGPSSEGAGVKANINNCTKNAGMFGFMCDITGLTGAIIGGSTYSTTAHPEMAQAGLDMTGLNLSVLAQNAGSTCTVDYIGRSADYVPVGIPGTSSTPALAPVGAAGIPYFKNCPYIENILISISVAALLTYIMLALLSYIPTLASNLTTDLVTQDGISAGHKMLTGQVLGESEMKSGLDHGKNAAMRFSSMLGSDE